MKNLVPLSHITEVPADLVELWQIITTLNFEHDYIYRPLALMAIYDMSKFGSLDNVVVTLAVASKYGSTSDVIAQAFEIPEWIWNAENPVEAAQTFAINKDVIQAEDAIRQVQQELAEIDENRAMILEELTAAQEYLEQARHRQADRNANQ